MKILIEPICQIDRGGLRCSAHAVPDCCHRCGVTLADGCSIIEPRAGALAIWHDEPVVLCSECSTAFDDWLRAPRENTEVRLTRPRASVARAARR
jgi:hypothetical protein